MKAFKWTSEFETGLKDVDDQHRSLVELTNQLAAELAENDMQSEQVRSVLSELTSYAAHHFADEEKLMAGNGLDARHCESHIGEHNRFRDDVNALLQKYTREGRENGESLLEFLTNWLVYHILGSDQNMARQIKAIKAGTSPVDAYTAKEQRVSASIEPLLSSLRGLFQQVSQRNGELLELNRTLEAKVEERTKELLQANRNLEILAMTDSLTELPNRRYAMLQLQALWQEAMHNSLALSCMVLDADGFKAVNDSYGHDAGDHVLRCLARELQHSVRSDDIVCRMGGDEFLIICPATPLVGALRVAETARSNVAELKVKVGEGYWPGSISVGVAALAAETNSVDDLLKSADDGVYLAKREGRNCVRTRQTVYRYP